MWTCWSIYSFKKLWENIPPHVNMCKCITGAVCVTHRDRRGLLRCQAQSRGTASCREAESGCGSTRSPASSSGVARPLRPHGAGRGAGPLAGQAAPRRAPAVPCSRGLTVGRRCHAEVPQSVREGFGVGKKGVSLHLNTTAGHSLLRYPGQLQGRLPSSPADGGVWPCRRGRKRCHPGLFKERDSRARKSQSSRARSPSGWDVLQRKVRRSPGLCLNTCGGLPLPPAACVRARTRTHTQTRTRTHTHRWKKPTTWIIFCAI